jgi:hypothetical protein
MSAQMNSALLQILYAIKKYFKTLRYIYQLLKYCYICIIY